MLTRSRRELGRPGQVGQRAAGRRGLERPVGEELADVIEEEGRRLRRALLVGHPRAQHEPPLGPRGAGVEEQPLAVELVLAHGQRDASGRADLAAQVVGEEGLRHGAAGELALLEPEHDHDREAPRAHGLGRGDAHPLGRGRLSQPHGCLGQEGGQRGGLERGAKTASGEPGDIRQGGPRRAQHGRVFALARGQEVRSARVRTREEPLEPAVELVEQPRTPAGRAQPVDLLERPTALLPEAASNIRALDARTADIGLELIGEMRGAQASGGPEVGDEVRGRALGGGAPEQGEQPAAERGVPERDGPLEREGDAVGLVDLFDQARVGGRIAHHDRHLARRDPILERAQHLGARELHLGALAAGEVEGDGVARTGGGRRGPGMDRPGRGETGGRGFRGGGDRIDVPRGLAGGRDPEQTTLDQRQARSGLRRVVRAARRELDVLLGELRQQGERRRRGAKGEPARLEGQRHRHLRAHPVGQGLDRIELDRGEVVEAVDEDRARAESRADRGAGHRGRAARARRRQPGRRDQGTRRRPRSGSRDPRRRRGEGPRPPTRRARAAAGPDRSSRRRAPRRSGSRHARSPAAAPMLRGCATRSGAPRRPRSAREPARWLSARPLAQGRPVRR